MNKRKVLKEKLLDRLDELPESRLQEVLDFIDFLRTRKKCTEDPILNVAGCLSGPPLSAEEMEKGLYGENPT